MLNKLNSDLVNAFLLALVIIGVGLVGFGVIQFINTTNQLNDNSAYQARVEGGEVALNSNAQAQGLMASDLERRDLVDQRFQSLIIGGAGLILLAIGWIAFDITRNRRKKDEEITSIPSAVPEASLQ